MYRSDLNNRDKGGAIAAVVAIHAALLFALLNVTGHIDLTDPQSPIRMFDVTDDPPPPPEPIQQQQQKQRERPQEDEGSPSPENIRSKATPIVDPKPRIALPLPVPMAVTETPNEGAQATQGAAPVPGPGTGAGGTGTGTGSGGAGSGTGGGGGGGGVAVPPSLIRGITNRDYPQEIQRRWPRGGRIFLRLRIEPNGRPSQCDVMRSYGDPVADQWTCRLIMDRATFRPAVDRRGVPVSGWFGYVQSDRGPGGR